MTYRRHVVVGLTDAVSAGRTLAWALRAATVQQADLVAVRAGVRSQELLGAAAHRSIKALELVDPALARAIGAARLTLGESRVSIVVDRDPAGEVLARVAKSGDIVVIGPPTRQGWWARASTTYHCAVHAPCPVIVVHPTAASTAASTADEGIGRSFRSHVVVGVDGSSGSREALGFAFAYAEERSLPLAAVTITHHLDTDVWFDDWMLETHLGVEPAMAAALASVVEPWQLKHPTVHVKRAIVAGRAAEGLRRVAHGAELLAVGTSGVGVAPLGSCSRDLLGHAPCPVAVVRAQP
jgi:nucleotide-binding universal stress UspA family protein